IVETEWEDSDLCEYLTSAKFLLVIFEETSNDEELFKGVKFWRMPSSDLNGLVYDTWKRTIDTLNQGVTLEYIPRNNKKGYIVETEWEDSDLCEYLTSAKFLLVIFEETSNDEELFKGVKFWRMPSSDLNGLVYDTWKRTIDTLNQGVTLEYIPRNNKKGYIVENNLPSIKDKTILHVRPDSRVSS